MCAVLHHAYYYILFRRFRQRELTKRLTFISFHFIIYPTGVYRRCFIMEQDNSQAQTESCCNGDCCLKRKHREEKEYRDLIHRLSRIEGQVRGIRAMVEEERYCVGSLTPKIPQSLNRLIFFRQKYIFVLRTSVLYSKMYLYQYIPGGFYAIKI